MGTEFPWRRGRGTISANLDVIWGMSDDIVGDELSGAEMARQLSEALGRTIKYSELLIAGLRTQSEDTAVMFEWLNAVGYSADIDGLRREFSDVNWLRFADWAKTQSLG